MSYDVSLMKGGVICQVSRHTEGGTYALGGTEDAELSITYNYARPFAMTLPDGGIRWLHEKTAAETIGAIERAVGMLGVQQYHDYWAPTPGNAGHALNILLGWARLHPDGVWHVS